MNRAVLVIMVTILMVTLGGCNNQDNKSAQTSSAQQRISDLKDTSAPTETPAPQETTSQKSSEEQGGRGEQPSVTPQKEVWRYV